MNVLSIQQALRDESLDGWLFYDHHRRDPLAYRVLGLSNDLIPTRQWYYFIPAYGEPLRLVHRVESNILDSLTGEKRTYSKWAEKISELTYILGKAKRVAMQYSESGAIPYVSFVDGGTIDLIRSLGVEVCGSANLVQLFEARWSAGQLESHFEAARRMDAIRTESFTYLADRLRVGEPTTEWDVRSFLLRRFDECDMITDHGPIVAVNANTSDPHYEPTAHRHSVIGNGDLVLIDMWAKLRQAGAVYYDITWTGYVGLIPPSEIVNVFNIVTSARDKAIGFVVDSVRLQREVFGFQVDDIARRTIGEAGLDKYFVHRTGHSIGTDVHGAGANMDNLETHDIRRIIPRTCFSIEPGIYLPEFGIRSEVNIYVGEIEARVTGETQKHLVPIV